MRPAPVSPERALVCRFCFLYMCELRSWRLAPASQVAHPVPPPHPHLRASHRLRYKVVHYDYFLPHIRAARLALATPQVALLALTYFHTSCEPRAGFVTSCAPTTAYFHTSCGPRAGFVKSFAPTTTYFHIYELGASRRLRFRSRAPRRLSHTSCAPHAGFVSGCAPCTNLLPHTSRAPCVGYVLGRTPRAVLHIHARAACPRRLHLSYVPSRAPRADLLSHLWIAEVESFYCPLEECVSETASTSGYDEAVSPGIMCEGDGSIDLSEFLREEIKAPCRSPATAPHSTRTLPQSARSQNLRWMSSCAILSATPRSLWGVSVTWSGSSSAPPSQYRARRREQAATFSGAGRTLGDKLDGPPVGASGATAAGPARASAISKEQASPIGMPMPAPRTITMPTPSDRDAIEPGAYPPPSQSQHPSQSQRQQPQPPPNSPLSGSPYAPSHRQQSSWPSLFSASSSQPSAGSSPAARQTYLAAERAAQSLLEHGGGMWM
ncbi:hypothetical protein B0H19DRAFT_1261270 [Mycena capillaripes]|nr:hypothetical protein B0H19DRAFT_1261270 [Mycena capillaripes]